MQLVRLALLSLVILAATASNAGDRKEIQVSGASRSYVLRIPEHLSSASRVPLVIVLHGGGGNAANAEKMTGFTKKAQQENFIVVYPEGSGRMRKTLLTWNVKHCCAYAMKENVDDVGFINALIDHLIKTYPIDEKRIYVTGMSNGGMMTHRLGIELSHRIAAIAPVVATVFGDEHKPTQPVAALIINGLLDKNVPFVGGSPAGRGKDSWDGTPLRPAIDQATFWAKANQCTSQSSKQDSPSQTHWRYQCPVGHDVELLAIKDNGHAWPSGEKGSRRGNKPSQSLNATKAIWDFFKVHLKQ